MVKFGEVWCDTVDGETVMIVRPQMLSLEDASIEEWLSLILIEADGSGGITDRVPGDIVNVWMQRGRWVRVG